MLNRWDSRHNGFYALGLRSGGSLSNMSVSMFAWIAQFEDVSFLAVTRTEYRWATVRLSKSIVDGSTSVYYLGKKKVRFTNCYYTQWGLPRLLRWSSFRDHQSKKRMRPVQMCWRFEGGRFFLVGKVESRFRWNPHQRLSRRQQGDTSRCVNSRRGQILCGGNQDVFKGRSKGTHLERVHRPRDWRRK